MITKVKLHTELSLIFDREEFSVYSGVLLYLIVENNLQLTFLETIHLLQIQITTPMTTSEAERGFSALKRIKAFLRTSMSNKHINTLTILSIEKRLLKCIHSV